MRKNDYTLLKFMFAFHFTDINEKFQPSKYWKILKFGEF